MSLLVPAGRFTCPLPQRKWDGTTFTFLAGAIGVQAQWMPVSFLAEFPFKEPFVGELAEEDAVLASMACLNARFAELSEEPGITATARSTTDLFAELVEEPGIKGTLTEGDC